MTWVLLLFVLASEPPAVTVGATDVRPGGAAQRSLTGAGVTVGLWDKGVPRATHEDFAGRVLFPRIGSTDSHATSVAGVIFGQSVGLAPGAALRPFIYDTNDLDSMRVAAQNGIRLSAHPYQYPAGWEFKSGGWAEMAGCSSASLWRWRGVETESETRDVLFGRYTAQSASWDAFSHDEPTHLAVVAAGNHQDAGPVAQPVTHCYYSYSLGSWTETDAIVRDLNAGMTAMAVSKNTLTVGTWPNLASTSRGPTEDGRIKPDIVAPGQIDDVPTSASTSSYGSLSQTSAATAAAAGGLALVHEHLTALLGQPPLASTLKALVIHSAQDKGVAGPDPVFGWGLLDVERAVRVASLDRVIEGELGNGQTVDIEVSHAGFGDLVATLVWTDPAGTTEDVLVNDLDLALVGQTVPDNSVDNVEQIRFSGLDAGTYTVRISHKGTLGASQAFSVVVSSGNKQRRVLQHGSAGWRLVSVPFAEAPFSRMSETFITQFGGAGGQETIYRFTSGQTYRSVTDPDTLTQPGRGYLLYVFDADAPKEWIMDGAPVEGPLILPPPWNSSPETSFLLAGNPFHGVLDWDAVVAASTGIANTYYVWDPSGTSGGGVSGFRHHTAGDPGSGDAGRFIPPFTGFFTFAMEPDAELVLDASALVRGSEPVFMGKERSYPHVRLSDGIDEVRVSVNPLASQGWDRFDVPQPSPLDGRIPLALLDADGRRFRAMAVPAMGDELRIRLSKPARILHDDLGASLQGEFLVLSPAASETPLASALVQAWPNPFNPKTEIGYRKSEHSHTAIRIFDMLGREVAVLVDGFMPPGEHSVTFDATKLASGVYMVIMREAGRQVGSLKLTLLR